ncbi:MAG: hypothetical protein Athens071416_35 [Parcubacteria group bacterium Athens0714_16]|nr:MAG: hypothetical protein Athens071416_35 [Parcubacteria group bacterium Athens0714_16]
MNLNKLTNFLKTAKKNTYASEKAKRITSQKSGSKDYEYKEGEFLYHDTYFGSHDFIGEEIIYENGKPIWGMNYNGYIIDEKENEKDIYIFLRKALAQDYDDIIPVRGPKNFKIENYEYKNNTLGTLGKFEGREEILKDGKLIYYAIFHGGFIK